MIVRRSTTSVSTISCREGEAPTPIETRYTFFSVTLCEEAARPSSLSTMLGCLLLDSTSLPELDKSRFLFLNAGVSCSEWSLSFDF